MNYLTARDCWSIPFLSTIMLVTLTSGCQMSSDVHNGTEDLDESVVAYLYSLPEDEYVINTSNIIINLYASYDIPVVFEVSGITFVYVPTNRFEDSIAALLGCEELAGRGVVVPVELEAGSRRRIIRHESGELILER